MSNVILKVMKTYVHTMAATVLSAQPSAPQKQPSHHDVAMKLYNPSLAKSVTTERILCLTATMVCNPARSVLHNVNWWRGRSLHAETLSLMLNMKSVMKVIPLKIPVRMVKQAARSAQQAAI